ncbi:MAG: T9SS type A sorting domain-containing protein [Chitinophagales bacterium]
MRKILPFLLSALFVATAFMAKAQTRYLDEVFTDVQVDTTVVYAQNYEFFSGFAQLKPLVMDVYRPVGDTATHRPLILLSHNGSFLPENITGALLSLCFKGRKDSSMVELCKRFARRGYVAVSFDYRLGWNATSSVQETRTATIIQAVYRAMQDSKSLVRYFKNDYSTNGNSWGIDTAKIVIGGSNSGAYVALAASSLNALSEINDIKFVGTNGAFIKQDTIGDFDGFGGFQNHDNYPGISSKFQCVLALGGAVGDTSWIQAGETPIISFHGVNESGTPYNTGIVTTTTGQPVIEVSGAGDYMPKVDAFGNNNAFKPSNFQQGPPNKNGAGQTTTSIEGLYPFYGQGFEPWNWYEPNCYNASTNMQTLNPGANPSKASLYIDTIMGYSTPRLYKLLIDQNYMGPSGINEVKDIVSLKLFPNPASSEINVSITANEKPITSIQLFDVTGRLVKDVTNINAFVKTIAVADLSNGIYTLSVKLTDGSTAGRRIAIQK